MDLKTDVTRNASTGLGRTAQGATATLERPEKKPIRGADSDLYVRPAARSTQVAPAMTPVPAAPASTTPAPSGKNPILLFNDECAVCRRLAKAVAAAEKKDPNGAKLDLRAIGDDPDAVAALNPNLNIWEAYGTVHVLMPDGSMKAGGEAVAEVLRRLPTTRWFAGIFDFSVFGHRPFQATLNGAYHFLDRIRPALGCESCGEGPPKWAMPIAWAVKGWKKLFGKAESKDAPKPIEVPKP